MVSFTGGLATGRIIAGEAAKSVKKVALELGGKNPNIIFADADYEAALDNALNGAFLHSGQVCSAGARIIVEESIAERFIDDLVERASQIKLGGPLDEQTETGALISREHLEKVAAYVDQARDQGARVRVGGGDCHWADCRWHRLTGRRSLLPSYCDRSRNSGYGLCP